MQKLRVMVDLEVPDNVDVDKLTEALTDMFPGRVRFAEENDLVVFFRPDNETGEMEWGTIPPADVVQYCQKTANQLARPVPQEEVYYSALGEVLSIAGRLAAKNMGG